MKTEIKFKAIGTRAVVSKEITPAQASEILQKNPPLTQVDTPSGYYLSQPTTQTENLAELVALLSQAIDIIREYNGESDADYLEKEMESVIQKIKKTT